VLSCCACVLLRSVLFPYSFFLPQGIDTCDEIVHASNERVEQEDPQEETEDCHHDERFRV